MGDKGQPSRRLLDFQQAKKAGLSMPPPPSISSLKMLSWNCRGLGKNDTMIYLKKMVGSHRLDCLFFMETKIDKGKWRKSVETLKFPNSYIVETVGMGGDIALLWIEELNIQCMPISRRILKCTVKDGVEGHTWNLLTCHGTPYKKEKKEFWENLSQVIDNCVVSWLLVGDLNEVIDDSKKQGGMVEWRKHLFLKNMLHDSGEIDL